MIDKLDTLMHSLIQHGKLNDRIFLLKLVQEDYPGIIFQLNDLAQKNGYSKLIAKVPPKFRQCFVNDGYFEEAYIPGFFNGKSNKKNSETALLMSKFRDAQRSNNLEKDTIEAVLVLSRKKGQLQKTPQLNSGYTFRIAKKKDVYHMANLYKKVFPTYPFPVDDPDYLAQTMEENSLYFSIWKEDKLVSLSSAEMDKKEKNAEMTDFGTLPEHRGWGFALFLLEKMEKEIKKRGIKTAYTIARAISFGMNITFAQAGYTYSGTLINNTNISGQIESMNIWYRSLI
jgi:putative beta-lysine N-acetyltransferase